MTDLKLSDLAGPGASGFSDVAVFVRADGSESEPFVVVRNDGLLVVIAYEDSRSARAGGNPVRRLGRGRLVPARIEMEGEELSPTTMKLAEAVIGSEKVLKESYRDQVKLLREALAEAEVELAFFDIRGGDTPIFGRREKEIYHGVMRKIHAALAATTPKPTEDAK